MTKKKSQQGGLRYCGRGFLAGIPARDLTADEVEQCGGADALIATGLYEAIEAPQQTKSERGGSEDKETK